MIRRATVTVQEFLDRLEPDLVPGARGELEQRFVTRGQPHHVQIAEVVGFLTATGVRAAHAARLLRPGHAFQAGGESPLAACLRRMPLAEGQAAALADEWHRSLGTATDAERVARTVVQRLGEQENYHRLATPPDTTHPGAARVATVAGGRRSGRSSRSGPGPGRCLRRRGGGSRSATASAARRSST
jgi:hypothetical protein